MTRNSVWNPPLILQSALNGVLPDQHVVFVVLVTVVELSGHIGLLRCFLLIIHHHAVLSAAREIRPTRVHAFCLGLSLRDKVFGFDVQGLQVELIVFEKLRKILNALRRHLVRLLVLLTFVVLNVRH